MEFLNKISLKQATLYALIGSVIGLIVYILEMFDYFAVYTLIAVISHGTLALFLYKLYSKQAGGE